MFSGILRHMLPAALDQVFFDLQIMPLLNAPAILFLPHLGLLPALQTQHTAAQHMQLTY